MTHTKYYNVCKFMFNRGGTKGYTIDQVYSFTTLEENALTAEEFYEITGVTIEEYEAK